MHLKTGVRIKINGSAVKYFFSFCNRLIQSTTTFIFSCIKNYKFIHFKRSDINRTAINENIPWNWLWDCGAKVLGDLNEIYILNLHNMSPIK